MKKVLFANPRLFRVLRVFWQAAILPRELSRVAAHRWSTRGFATRQPVDVVCNGQQFRIVVDPVNGLVDETIFARRAWAPDICAALHRVLRRGDTFVDIGANIGFFTLLGARLVGDTGRVIAFEPLAELTLQLQESVRANALDNIDVRQRACAAAAGEAELFAPPLNRGGSSLHRSEGLRSEGIVRLVRLDDELAAERRIDVIKLDVEGAEYEALLGAERTLAAHRPTILLEYSPSLYESVAPGRATELIRYLEKLGYMMCELDGTPIRDTRALTVELVMRSGQRDVLWRTT